MTLTFADLRDHFLGIDPELPPQRAMGGGAYADLFVEDTQATSVLLEGGEIVRVARDVRRGFAVRAISAGGQTRIATSTTLDDRAAASLAAEIAFPGDRPAAATPEAKLSLHASVARIHPESVSLDRRIALAELADKVARATSPKIKEASVTVRDVVRKTAVSASDGAIAAQELLRAIVVVEAIATDGSITQSAHEAAGGTGGLELIDEATVETCARLAAERAVRMVGARPAPAGEMPVVLASEAGGTFVHEAVGHSLEADLVIEGLSALGKRIGERVAAEAISVFDDATVAQKNGSFMIDDEAIPAERTMLIDRGVLVSLLHDRRTAMLLGARSSGKGRRESFRDRPIVRMSNTMIAPGADDPRAIVKDTGRGLYVVRMGGGEVDTVTGQFVFEVSEAYTIENGAIADPVRGATLAGDCEEVLETIDRVGSDLGFGIGTCGKDGQDVAISDAEPTIRVPALVVGGA